jgi:hypothetical protein
VTQRGNLLDVTEEALQKSAMGLEKNREQQKVVAKR